MQKKSAFTYESALFFVFNSAYMPWPRNGLVSNNPQLLSIQRQSLLDADLLFFLLLNNQRCGQII